MDSNSGNNSSSLKGLCFALVGFAAYSGHDAVVKVLGDYSAFQILFFAMLFTYVPFSMARIFAGTPLSLKPIHPKFAIARGVLHVCSLGFAFSAFMLLPMVDTYVLLFCTPVIISILATFFLGEKITVVRWFLILLGLIGVVIVLRPSIETVKLGHLFALCAAFTSATSAIIARKVGAIENMATMILFPLLGTIIVSGIALIFVYKPMPLHHLGMMFLIGGMGLFGQYCIISGFKYAPAAYVGPMQYSQIVWAILFGYLFFDESVDVWAIVGSSLTIFSGIGIVLRERKVSKVQANINTRNSRAIGAPLIDGD